MRLVLGSVRARREPPRTWRELERTQPMRSEHTEPERPARHGTRASARSSCPCPACEDHRAAERAYSAAYRASHREQVRASSAAWAAAHREELLAYHAAYRASNPEVVRAWEATYRASHPESVRARDAAYYAANSEVILARSAAWHLAHPEAVQANNHRRRARLADVDAERFTLADVIARDGWRCGICGRKVDPKATGRNRKSLDHVVPISLGGPHTLANAQLAHFGCNAAKGARATLPAPLRMFG